LGLHYNRNPKLHFVEAKPIFLSCFTAFASPKAKMKNPKGTLKILLFFWSESEEK